MKAPYVFDDEFIAGWTNDDVRAHFRLNATLGSGHSLHYPSIVNQIRRGVKGFDVADMRTGGAHLRVKTKRAATRIAKLIEADRTACHILEYPDGLVARSQ